MAHIRASHVLLSLAVERGIRTMRFALSIRQRLLFSHLFAVVVVAGTFGAVVYWVAAEQVARAGSLYALRLSAALAFLVCVLAALVLSRLLANRIVARITDLAFRCRVLAAGQPLPSLPTGKADELDDLAREFDAMAARLRDAARDRENAHTAVREANARLEQVVRGRTSELERATAQLKAELEQRTRVQALLAEAALTDALTGLVNRRAMMEMLEQAAGRHRPGAAGLSVIVADIDHFKKVNDRFGHDTGDRVLRAVAGRLRELAGDGFQRHVARWGGEEFLVLLQATPLADAVREAERIRRAVATLDVDGRGLRVTLSVGVANLESGESLDDCLRRGDQALYKAKDAGRNAVVVADGATFSKSA